RTSVSHCTHRLLQQITRIAAEQLYSPDSRKLNSGRVGNSLENRIRFSLILERPHRNVRPPAPARRQRDLPRPRQHRWRALRSCRERRFCCLRFGLDARTRGTPYPAPRSPPPRISINYPRHLPSAALAKSHGRERGRKRLGLTGSGDGQEEDRKGTTAEV